jgi:PAS domain S-box-containing protein
MSTSTKTILLVEDEALIALAEKRKLEQAGYKVFHSSTGESAVDIVNEDPAAVDLILMDINLGPGIDGTKAAQDILRNHDIPIVFLSSHTEPEIVEKTEEITNYGYVVKSSVFTVLDASIKMAFKLFRAKKQLDLDSMEIESANEELRKSLAKLQNAYDDLALHKAMLGKYFRLSPDAICITRVSDGVYKDVNRSFSRLFGFSREEALGRSCFSGDLAIWLHQEEREKLATRLREDGGEISAEIDFRRKDGTIITTSTNAELIEINGEDCVISSIRDISESKRNENSLRESEERYRMLFEEAGAGILIYNRDLRILDANKKAVQMFDYSKDDLLALSLRQLDPDLADPRILNGRVEGILGSGPYTFMAKRQRKDGMVLPVEVNAMSILWQGKPAFMAIVYDIGEKIEKERQYAKSQAILKSTLESQNDVLMVGIDKEFRCLYFSKSYHDLKAGKFGLDMRIGDCILDDLPQDKFLERSLAHYRSALSGTSTRIVEEYADFGMTFDSVFNPIRGSDGEILGASGFLIDVSERMALEKKLREKESQLKTIGDNVPAFVAILDASSLRYQYVNRMYELSYGLTKEQILGKTIRDIAGVENYQNATKYLTEALHGQNTSYERQFSLAQGETWGRLDYVPQFDEKGKVERVLILGVDITNLKNTAEALRLSEERFRLAMDAADEGIWDCNLRTDEIYYSPAYYQMVGLNATEIGRPGEFNKYVHPDDYAQSLSAMNDCIENRKGYIDFDYRLHLKDGTWKWISTHGKVVERDATGKATRMIGTSRDITDRKQNEERIAAITNELQTILDTAPIGIAKIVEGKFVWINKAIPDIFGYSVDDLMHKELSLLFPSMVAFFSVANKMRDSLSGGEGSFRMIEKLVRGAGQLLTVYLSGKAIDRSDISEGLILTAEDITRQKLLEDKLVASEDKYRALFKAVSDALCIIDRESGTILDCNEATVAMFGYVREEIIGTAFTSTSMDPDKTTIAEIANNRLIPLHYLRKKDGAALPIEITTSLLNIDGKDVIVAAMRDISRRMESEQEIRQLLREKELILREVHHRIKNNLQVVASILAIRVADSGDANVNATLNEAIGEIESMSLLYDQLYRTEYTGTIPLRTYFPELLSQAAQLFGKDIPVTIETEIEDISLDAGKLSRLGIIVNELLTDSLKYAFAGIAKPKITLRALRHGARVHLEYEDNGIGLPESFSMQSTEGFGIQVIQALMQQIRGTINAEIRKGAKFTIDFDA